MQPPEANRPPGAALLQAACLCSRLAASPPDPELLSCKLPVCSAHAWSAMEGALRHSGLKAIHLCHMLRPVVLQVLPSCRLPAPAQLLLRALLVSFSAPAGARCPVGLLHCITAAARSVVRCIASRLLLVHSGRLMRWLCTQHIVSQESCMQLSADCSLHRVLQVNMLLRWGRSGLHCCQASAEAVWRTDDVALQSAHSAPAAGGKHASATSFRCFGSLAVLAFTLRHPF